MKIQSSQDLGAFIKEQRKKLGVTQKELAMTAGTGHRFIIDLEKGKTTCHLGKALEVLQVLGTQIDLHQVTEGETHP